MDEQEETAHYIAMAKEDRGGCDLLDDDDFLSVKEKRTQEARKGGVSLRMPNCFILRVRVI